MLLCLHTASVSASAGQAPGFQQYLGIFQVMSNNLGGMAPTRVVHSQAGACLAVIGAGEKQRITNSLTGEEVEISLTQKMIDAKLFYNIA